MLNENENNTSLSNTQSNSTSVDVAKKPTKKMPFNIIGLIILVILVVGAIAGFSLLQKQQDLRQQADVQKVQTCSLTFNVAPENVIDCLKTIYRDELTNSPGNYTLLEQQTTFEPGDIVVFVVTANSTAGESTPLSLIDPLNTGNLNNYVEFMDSNCGDDAYDDTNKILTCPAALVETDSSHNFIFRVKLLEGIPNGTEIANTASIVNGELNTSCQASVFVGVEPSPSPTPEITPSPTPTPEVTPTPEITPTPGVTPTPETTPTPRVTPTPIPTPTPTIGCNESCISNGDCANPDQICYSNKCRLAEYPQSPYCAPPASPTPTPPVVPTPTPTIGCNDRCSSNNDCSNSNHLCYQGRCRLAEYPESQYCSPPSTPPQPVLPPELPKSGSEDILNWLKAGLGVIGAGALLLLLL